MPRNRGNGNLTNIINTAINNGIFSLSKEHPEFRGKEEFIKNYLDSNILNEKINESYARAQELGYDENRTAQYIQQTITKEISDGKIFDNYGKRIILKEGLSEEKRGGLAKLMDKIGMTISPAERKKDLKNTMGAFRDLYSLFKAGDYAERMPELEKALITMKEMDFLDPALDILRAYDLIGDSQYDSLKKTAYQKMKKSGKEVVGGIEKYITQKAAATIMGLLGALMVITSPNITGGVVGVAGSEKIKLLGAILFLMSILLFLGLSKKKGKIKSVKRIKKKSKTFKNR